LVHADPFAPSLPDLIEDMARKVDSGHLFGGLASGREPPVTIADRVLQGGLSGVVFAADVALVSRVTQGCYPLPGGRRRKITAGEDNLIEMLDDERAFDALLRDAGIVENVAALNANERTREALAQLKALGRRGLLFVGIEPEGAPSSRDRRLRDDYLVRPVVAIDPARGAVAVGMPVECGQTVRFCARDEAAARKDLTRICAEVRDHLHEQSEKRRRTVAAKGAIYVSCVGRGTHMFGEQSEEMRLIAQQLGEVPLVGFYASGEISGRSLYGFTGLLTVFY
jgi:small ligand-binding sensory domain FIST